MSTDAERWAARQRGLTPAQERILRALAQFNTLERGCFPSQNTLAQRTGISLSSLNANLAVLEQHGLIRREKRWKQSGHVTTTRYHLNLDVLVDIPRKEARKRPSPNSGVSRLQKSEKSQYQDSERLNLLDFAKNGLPDTDCIARWLIAQAGPGLCGHGRAIIRTTDHVIEAWVADGYDLEEDILPAVKARTRRPRRQAIETWTYFTAAIREIHERRTSKIPAPTDWKRAGFEGSPQCGRPPFPPHVASNSLEQARAEKAKFHTAIAEANRAMSLRRKYGVND